MEAVFTAMPPSEQNSHEEHVRTMQSWFGCAGNTGNGTPRLVPSMRGQQINFMTEHKHASVRPWA